ncbi:MAG: hypothetical protein FD141_659 [Fusobacteria bacterium]|nr:MAG: hypothetical protein FD141_659 [Fusobacteriota bacterium]KAF0228675.1 MAG: hypothetical protein FD182_931 [Fusobacteriota bacterium]
MGSSVSGMGGSSFGVGRVLDEFCVEGFSLVYRGRGELVGRDAYLLKGGGVEFLLPVYFYRENLDFVFVYDLEGGYSLGERLDRGDGGFGVDDFVSILERVDFVSSEYFFDLSSFYISPESIVYSMDGCGLVYCPFYKGDFWGGVLSLFGSVFSGESWFMDYLDRLEALGNSFSISSFLGVVRLFGSVCVGDSVSNDVGSVRSVGRISSYGGNVSGGNGFGSGSGVRGFGGLLGSRGFGVGGSSSVATSGFLSGFDWWSFVLGFVGGGAGNVGCLVLLVLFVGFVLGLFI